MLKKLTSIGFRRRKLRFRGGVFHPSIWQLSNLTQDVQSEETVSLIRINNEAEKNVQKTRRH